MDKVTPWLWCNDAEAMVAFYTGLIPGSRIVETVRSPIDTPSGQAGSVLTIEFTLAGRHYFALNGGNRFPFTEAISLQLLCEDQAEVDRYWSALSAHPEHEQCGWLKDRYGLSWQVVPRRMMELLSDPDRVRARRAMGAMMTMKKLDIAALEQAADGD